MAGRQTDFYNGTTHIYSDNTLGLIEQKCDISPAKPKINMMEIPGANGSIDLTEVLGVGVKYYDREIVWTYALYPGTNRAQKFAEVSNKLNGKRFMIYVHGDSTFYYDGRISVEEYKVDNLLNQITVKAICKPYKLKVTQTVQKSISASDYTTFSVNFGDMALSPTFNVTQPTSIQINGVSYTATIGDNVFSGLMLTGQVSIKAKAITSSGVLKVIYQAGSL